MAAQAWKFGTGRILGFKGLKKLPLAPGLSDVRSYLRRLCRVYGGLVAKFDFHERHSQARGQHLLRFPNGMRPRHLCNTRAARRRFVAVALCRGSSVAAVVRCP